MMQEAGTQTRSRNTDREQEYSKGAGIQKRSRNMTVCRVGGTTGFSTWSMQSQTQAKNVLISMRGTANAIQLA
jgi:hypothetical protein